MKRYVHVCEVCGDFLELDPECHEIVTPPCGEYHCPSRDSDMVIGYDLDSPEEPEELDFNDD